MGVFNFKKYVMIAEAKIDDLASSKANDELPTDHSRPIGFTPEDMIRHIHANNPSGDINHTHWLYKQHLAGDLKHEDIDGEGRDLLTNFNRYRNRLPKKNIMQYKDKSELHDAIRPFINTTKNEQEQNKKQAIISAGSTLVHSGPNVNLYHVHNKEASKELGAGMPWCTSHRNLDFNRFDHYNDESNKRFFIAHLPNEEAPYRKLGIAVGTPEFQDENNTQIPHKDLEDLVSRNPELKTIPHLQGARFATTKDPMKHISDLAVNDSASLKDMKLSPETLNGLVNHPNHKVRDSIAQHPDLQSHHIDELISDPDEYVRNTITGHRNLQSHHIDKLVNDPEEYVRRGITGHPKLQSHHIDKLVDDPDASVRGHIADHPNLQSHQIDKLVNDPDQNIRFMIASHPNLQNHHVNKLLNDPDEYVRKQILRNPNLQSHHIDKLINDPDPSVRSTIAENPNLQSHHFDKLVNDPIPAVRRSIAFHRKLQSHHIDKLVDDPSDLVRASVGHHRNLQSHHIDKLVNDPIPAVRVGVVNNVNLPDHHYDTLLNDPNELVRIYARGGQHV